MSEKTMTKKIALAGVFAALCMAIIWVAGMTMLDLSALVICAFMTMLLVVEIGEKMTWVYAAATSVLAFLLLPNKLYAIEYALFAAVYPILKLHFEKLRPLFAYPVKISCLDTMLLFCIVLGQYVFLAGEDYFSLGWVTIGLGTLFFLLFDGTLTVCMSIYLVKLRKKLRIVGRRKW